MAAITIGTAGLQFGIFSAESGIIVQTVDRASQRQKREVMNQNGDIVGAGYYAPKAVYTVTGVMLFSAGTAITAGLGTAYPGAVVALANVLNDTGSGVSGGHVYNDEMTIRQTNENFVNFSGSFTQYPSISSP